MDDLAEEPEDGHPPDPDGFEATRDVENERQDELPEGVMPPEQFLHDFDPLSAGVEAEPAEDDDGNSSESHEAEEGLKGADGEGEDDDDHPALLRIDESLLARVNEVFVEPSGYQESLQEQREQIIDSYVYIVKGDEHAGRLTCALYLAQGLLVRRGAENRIYCYRRRPDESPSRLDFVGQEGVKS